uniref:Uncharacterized protein n=1 Tax=Phytophthora ramorum TaxID=164328 RepID=H3H8J3_PHYRM
MPLAAGEGAEGSSLPTPPLSPGSSPVLAYFLGATPAVVSTPPGSPTANSISVGRLESATDLGEILSAAVAPARLSLAESEEIISLRDEIARLQAQCTDSEDWLHAEVQQREKVEVFCAQASSDCNQAMDTLRQLRLDHVALIRHHNAANAALGHHADIMAGLSARTKAAETSAAASQPGFCSSACVTKFFSSDSDSQELTPSSTSGISQSSTATVIDLAQREEEQEQEQEATDRIPDHIAHAPPMNSTDPIWDVIHQLEEAFTYKGKKFTHICLLCTESKTWKDSLCRASNSTNAKTHLVASHKDHEMAIQEQQRRLKRADRYMVQVNTRKNVKRLASSVRNSQEEQPIKRQKTWWKAPVIQEQISGHIARWLIRDGLPHNIVTTPAFRDFLVGVTGDPNVTVPAAKTYNEILDNHYDKFANDTSELFVEEFKELDETPFMTVEHDLWTNSSLSTMNGILGDSPFSRSSEEVADLLDEQLKARYGLDVRKMARFTISDTAAAARKVSSQFDSTLQTDCAMHALNLCISYGIGLKENVRNEYMKDERTKLFVKKRVVVTQGGAFPEGGAVIRKLRNLNNFFASSKSPERIARLRDVQKFHKLPQLAALIDIDVRVASTIKLFRRSIINYPAFQAFFQNANVAKGQKNVFT